MKIDKKEIRKKARETLKKNFFMSILLMFIITSVLNDNYSYKSQLLSKNESVQEVKEIVYDEETKKVDLHKLDKEDRKERKERFKGILGPIVGRLGITSSPLENIYYSIDLFVYEHDIGGGIFSLFIAFLSLILYFVIKIILEVGKTRFFLESRIYHKTNAMRLLFPYKVKKTFNISYILFIRRLLSVLWSLTIIGGFIKVYEYSMIPFILAENPGVSRKEAFRLSKEMMKGYKWESFKLDMSLIGWDLLGFFTFGIFNILYLDAYKSSIDAELYCYIRNSRKKELTDSKLLNDTALFDEKTKLDIYPDEKLKVPARAIKINTDYNQKYSIRNCILMFFTASFIGYAYEVFLHIIRDGKFVNRGTMFGPWLPIYGTGVVLILLLLKPFRKRPIIFFLSCMVLAGIVEYFTAWGLETFAHMKWWDYTGYFINLHGRICLEGLLVFGLGGSSITYFLAPLLNSLFNRVKSKVILIICIILVALFGADIVYSIQHPNTGEGITDY